MKYILIDGNVVDCLAEPIRVCVESINMQAHWMNLCVFFLTSLGVGSAKFRLKMFGEEETVFFLNLCCLPSRSYFSLLLFLVSALVGVLA